MANNPYPETHPLGGPIDKHNPLDARYEHHDSAPRVKEGEEVESVVNPLGAHYGYSPQREDKPIPDYHDPTPDNEEMIQATGRVQAIYGAISSGIARKYNDLLARLDKLRHDRIETENALLTKQELLPLAIEKFRAAQEEARKYLLVKHLDDARNHPEWLFNASQFDRRTRGNEHLFFTLLFSERDIENAVSMLPGDGMPQEDREKKIKAIDRESAKISKQIETEFADLEKE